MSTLRPTLRDSKPGEPGLTYDQTYYRVLQAVSSRRGLIHGRLRDDSGTCAIGAYFAEADVAINSKAIDEIAAYNDSFPHLNRRDRWRKVMAWLRTQVN